MAFSLRRKILLGYGIALILTATVLIWAVWNLLSLGRASDAILRNNYRSIIAASSMLSALDLQYADITLFLSNHDPSIPGRFRAGESDFLMWLGRAADNITEPGEPEIIASLQRSYARFLEQSNRMLSEKPDETGLSNSLRALSESFRLVRENCIRLRELNQAAMYRSSATARHVASHAVISMLVIGLAAILLGLGFSIVLADVIVRPVRRLTEASRDIAAGRYDVTLAEGSSDEIGMLSREFASMAGRLKAFHDMNVGRMLAEKKKNDSIIRNIDDGLIYVDAHFRVAGINPAAASIFGVDPAGAEGRHVLEIIRNEDLFERMKSVAGQSPAKDRPDQEQVLTFDHGDSREHYHYSIVPVRVDPGTNAGVLLILRDITRLKELDMLKSRFVMTASHELRTPISGALMSIDVLVEQATSRLTDKENELLGAARQELHRLRALVNDLLELSRIESGKIELAFERTNIGALIAHTAELMRNQAEARDIDLSHTFGETIPAVKADPGKVMWVLTNLVSNALRYTDPGGCIRLGAEPEGGMVAVSVEDNGAGIPFEFQSRIFDTFVQVKSDRDNGGTGLGLAICREIVRAHGGSIWVDSTPGRGSRFTFTLPVFPEKNKENIS